MKFIGSFSCWSLLCVLAVSQYIIRDRLMQALLKPITLEHTTHHNMYGGTGSGTHTRNSSGEEIPERDVTILHVLHTYY